MTWTDVLVQIIFGWPAILTSLAVSVLGVVRKSPGLLVVGAVLFAPFSYYLSGAPGVGTVMLLLPFFQGGAAYAVRQGRIRMAWLLLSPAFLISAWVAFLVLSQPR